MSILETELVPIPSAATPLQLHLTRADNHVLIWVNGHILINKDTEGDPALNITIDLTPYVSPGPNNSVVAICINRGGPYHIAYSVTQAGKSFIGVDQKGGGGCVTYAQGWNITFGG